jgi:hypothetical protein
MSKFASCPTTAFLLVLGLALSPAVYAQGTDECSDPLIPALTLGAHMASNVGATTSVGFAPVCAVLNSDVWFAFTPTNSGAHQIDTNNGNPVGQLSDTVLAIYSTCAPGPIFCDDDSGQGALSLINISLTAGVTYIIQVGDFGVPVQQGTFWINITFIPPPPSNDTCATAIPITEGAVVVGSTLAATTGIDPVGPCVPNGKDVWYSFTASCSGPFRVTTCGAVGYDEVVSVWSGTCGALNLIACDDDSCGAIAGPASIIFAATGNTTYYVSIAGYGTGTAIAAGTFHLLVNPGPNFTLNFFGAGPGTGSIGYTIAGGPAAGGSAFTAVTLTAGLYPNDWFFGIAMTIPEIGSQFNFGYPFNIPLGTCGDATVGPFFGLPSCLNVYAVSLGFPSGASFPSIVSNPANHTVP